jgi:hypothetical protein
LIFDPYIPEKLGAQFESMPKYIFLPTDNCTFEAIEEEMKRAREEWELYEQEW